MRACRRALANVAPCFSAAKVKCDFAIPVIPDDSVLAVPTGNRRHMANDWNINTSEAACDRFLAGDFEKLLVSGMLREAVDMDLHGDPAMTG
jgi:hypothetical protein